MTKGMFYQLFYSYEQSMVFAEEKNGRWTTTFQYTISEALDTIYYEDRLSADELRNKDSDKICLCL